MQPNHKLYRWINPTKKFYNPKLERVTTEVFRLRPDKEKELSVYWSLFITPLGVKHLSDKEETGIASVKVKQFKSLNLKPKYENTHKAHVNVYGEFDEEQCHRLAEIAVVEIPADL